MWHSGAVEVGRQWSYSQDRFFYGCYLTPEAMEALETQEHFLPFTPMDADIDWRIPMRIGAVVVALVIASGRRRQRTAISRS